MAKVYTTVQPGDLWKFFASGKIYKGGGNLTDPKMVRLTGLRPNDFDIVVDPKTGVETVTPNPKKGLSMATTIKRLADLKIEGQVWELTAPSKLPSGLLVNFEAPDHVLINVIGPTAVSTVIHLLKELGRSMKRSGVKITAKGEVVRQ